MDSLGRGYEEGQREVWYIAFSLSKWKEVFFYKENKSIPEEDQKAVIYAHGGPYPSSVGKISLGHISSERVVMNLHPHDGERLIFSHKER